MCTACSSPRTRAAERQQDDLVQQFEPRAVIGAPARGTVFMGVPTLYVRLLASLADARSCAHVLCSSAARRRC